MSMPAEVGQEAEYYLAHIASVKTVDDLLSDDRLYTFAMRAFGLGHLIGATAFIRKVLAEGAAARNAFALEVSDARVRHLAEVFDFAQFGPLTAARVQARQGVAERYSRQVLEERAGAADEGERLRLHFRRKAAEAQSIYGLLGDKDAYEVLRLALGFPAVGSGPALDGQSAEIARRISLAEFSDAERLELFLQRFTLEWQKRHGPASGRVPQAAVTAIAPQRLGGDVLMTLQAMKDGVM